ncbi:tripartite-type tricarboxylate transporter receptor subunit TctC [Advenella incenata]|jgi:tripartite-type tricarboxylate transporter receptor subunit TctC|uniref:Tripartite-type tricarboxylate transporter receptor subunit TctC n=1 Tax=Advenella incenata TaxID=267800 RepID=A0A4V2FSI9_9BURK|nr:tripartite tricarboxylate transporter substrate binding protein [Advenella incenata]RZT94499.1 tripartite-type tricarboxylate transporter receptor subunit TctC [Advenella incenata]
MLKHTRHWLGAALIAVAGIANAYPDKAITMIVPYAPGGSTDGLARIVADSMAKSIGASIIVENIGGVGGVPGVQKFLRAKQDGYTIMLSNMGSFAIAPTLYPHMKFDPKSEMEPLGLVAEVPMVLSVSAASGIKDLPTLLQRMRDSSQPRINLGNGGPGGTGHIGAEYFLYLTKTTSEMIPYRGTGPALVDLMAGTVDVVIDQTVAMIPASKGNRILPLAVASPERIPQMPDTPTFAEGGVPEFDMSVWNAIAAPKGIPRDRADKLVKALNEALDDPKVKAALDSLGAIAPQGKRRGPEEMHRLTQRDLDRFAKLIHDANIPINK